MSLLAGFASLFLVSGILSNMEAIAGSKGGTLTYGVKSKIESSS